MVRVWNIMSVIDDDTKVEIYGAEGHICTVTKLSRVPKSAYYREVKRIYPATDCTLCVILSDKKWR